MEPSRSSQFKISDLEQLNIDKMLGKSKYWKSDENKKTIKKLENKIHEMGIALKDSKNTEEDKDKIKLKYAELKDSIELITNDKKFFNNADADDIRGTRKLTKTLRKVSFLVSSEISHNEMDKSDVKLGKDIVSLNDFIDQIRKMRKLDPLKKSKIERAFEKIQSLFTGLIGLTGKQKIPDNRGESISKRLNQLQKRIDAVESYDLLNSFSPQMDELLSIDLTNFTEKGQSNQRGLIQEDDSLEDKRASLKKAFDDRLAMLKPKKH